MARRDDAMSDQRERARSGSAPSARLRKHARAFGRAAKVLAGGCAAALAVVAAGAGSPAAAKPSGIFSLQRINVAGGAAVPANAILEMTFSGPVDPASVRPETVQIRARNASDTGYTKQVFGTFQVAGRVVRFFPRLPGHTRDENGQFHPEGSAADNASENAGLQPLTKHEIRVIGRPAVTTVRSTKRKPLRRTGTAQFTTASGSSADELFTSATYSDSPPPEFQFSNPPDSVPTADTQYVTRGGTAGVINDISVSLFCTKVPLAPSTTRVLGNVTMTMLERAGNKGSRRPVPGSVFVEQNFETTLLSYRPRFPLADRGVYSLRVSKNVKDLTEEFDFEPNRQRERLRQIYDHLVTERSEYLATHPGAPTVPGEELDDPAAALIADWPPATDVAGRALLKENMLLLGDGDPDEIDPRVMVIFSTRDEPITDAELRFEFNKSDGLFDGLLSTGQYDDPTIPGAASAILTIAGGSAADGDFQPSGSTTLNGASYPDHVLNFRDVNIPQGVTVTITGTRPVTLKAITFLLNGVIDVSGFQGGDASTGNYTTMPTKPSQVYGGAGGPGGGNGGDCVNEWKADSSGVNYNAAANGIGKPGRPGIDDAGVEAIPGDGGQGGLGGSMGTGTYYDFGASGGGGGARTAGTAGVSGGYPSYPSWNGTGGAGGAGSTNEDLVPLVGGAGGGAGGNSLFAYTSYNWAKNAGGGGGGGGALTVQTSSIMTVGTTGTFRSRGGRGGNGTGATGTVNAGPGGGGGGGSILLRSGRGFNFANVALVDVAGGAGGTHSGSYTASPGGTGGTGYVRTEDPNGGFGLPNGTQGHFDPVGGGVPSYVYTKWADLGVEDPRILSFTNDDVQTNPTGNDAVMVEVQATREDPAVFGAPNTSALDSKQNSTDTGITSNWLPLKIHDLTGVPGGTFHPAGWDPGVDGTEYSGFPVDQLNAKGYRFVRLRIYFQLDGSQSRSDPIPSVDLVIIHFQFNI